MASASNRSNQSRRQGNSIAIGGSGNGAGDSGPTGDDAATTGRYLVLFREGAAEQGMQMLSDQLGMSAMLASTFEASAVAADTLASDNIVFDTLGVAVVNVPPDQQQGLSFMATDDSAILAVEKERIVYAIDDGVPVIGAPDATRRVLADYLRGYQAAVTHLVDDLMADGATMTVEGEASGVSAETGLTWGLQATGVGSTRFTGKGVRVAVLDTGFDFGHPDFAGRRISSRSFIDGETADDGHGHGTHCVGTACGPQRPGQMPRYGVASEAEIYVGKVLSNAGSGSDSGILAGIEWAIANNCAVISMSLGARTTVGRPHSAVFEAVARRALAAGALIVAAAGNNSDRPNRIDPVSHPANCPSILAVGAVDSQLAIARFSCGARNGNGGQVDIAGPGVDVRSSWLRPVLYRSISGTSMATPHVAGIAALYAEANPAMRGGTLGWLLLQGARRLVLPTRDVGAGLVQAPQAS